MLETWPRRHTWEQRVGVNAGHLSGVDLTQLDKLAFYRWGKCVSERQTLQDLLAKQMAKGRGQWAKE